MFYNKGLFEKNGLKAPTTWDEFMAANAKLKGAGITPIAIGAKDDWTLPIVHEVVGGATFGGAEFQKAVLSGAKDFTDPHWVASVKLLKDLEPVANLAESWDVSQDGMTVTFHLRSDGKWTNGDPVTAQDFEYSWKRTVSPDLAADYERRRRQSSNRPGDTWPFPPDQNPAAYQRVSPINYFEHVSAPVMLHHGTADTTVDMSASVAIADALRAAGKDVTLHLYEGGGHTLQGAYERQYFQRTLEFFQRHLGR